MKIFKGSIISLASRGYISLQIPDCSIGSTSQETEDVPDEWFNIVKGMGERVCLKRETGFLFLTKRGWEANKKQIKEAYLSAITTSGKRSSDDSWEKFEQLANDHFEKVKKANKKYIADLKKKIHEIEKAVI